MPTKLMTRPIILTVMSSLSLLTFVPSERRSTASYMISMLISLDIQLAEKAVYNSDSIHEKDAIGKPG